MVAVHRQAWSLASRWRYPFATDPYHWAQFDRFPLFLLRIFGRRRPAFAPSRCKLRKRRPRTPNRLSKTDHPHQTREMGHLSAILMLMLSAVSVTPSGPIPQEATQESSGMAEQSGFTRSGGFAIETSQNLGEYFAIFYNIINEAWRRGDCFYCFGNWVCH